MHDSIQACNTLIDWVKEYAGIDNGAIYTQRLDMLRALRRQIENIEETKRSTHDPTP